MRIHLNFMVILTIMLCLGCASKQTLSFQERDLAYIDYIEKQNLAAQDKISTFRFLGWQALSNTFLVISTSPRKKYLVEVNGYCPNLYHAKGLALNQGMSSTLAARFDSISIVGEKGSKCFVKTLHKVTKEQAKELAAIGKESKKDNENEE